MKLNDNITGFLKAEAVWLKGKSRIMNVQAGFEMDFRASLHKNYVLYITGSTLYRISVNGRFVHYGPARAPHGYLRIDSIHINEYIIEGINHVFIEVAGYNIGTYYTLDIASFIQAEIIEDKDAVICLSKIDSDFRGYQIQERVRKVARYSYQRNFSEIYHMDNKNTEVQYESLEVVVHGKRFLKREVPYPAYKIFQFDRIIGTGDVILRDKNRKNLLKPRFINDISDTIQGYKYEDIKEHPFEIAQKCMFHEGVFVKPHNKRINLSEKHYILIDMGCNNVGFILADIVAKEDSEIYFIFDEKLVDGKIDVTSWNSVNVIKYSLMASDDPYTLESFECYGFKYLQCFILKGRISLKIKGIREYSYPKYDNTKFHCDDDAINLIFKAAVETYRQNTLDVFMDCPTRERAGWLCDSFFTSQSEQFFSGNPVVEKVMMENYILAENFPYIPKGMIPMCYPAEHRNGNFIPQWAMWYIIEMYQYLQRDINADKARLRAICYGLVDFFKQYTNDDGLLEKLPGWNFIEWSEANKYVQGVHYPTNMLFSKMVEIIGTLYDDEILIDQALKIKKIILEQSFNGILFIDNAIRNAEGILEITDNKSEACQYFALFFGIADLENKQFNELRHLVLDIFGPNRKKSGIRPEIVYANVFIGNYLRMEILVNYGYYHKVVSEIKEYFHHMAAATGTLWEHDDMLFGSLNHGFASFIGVVIVKCILGIRNIDLKNKVIELDFSYKGKEAYGRIGTAFGDIVIKRELKDGQLLTECNVPDGFQGIINNMICEIE